MLIYDLTRPVKTGRPRKKSQVTSYKSQACLEKYPSFALLNMLAGTFDNLVIAGKRLFPQLVDKYRLKKVLFLRAYFVPNKKSRSAPQRLAWNNLFCY